MNSQRGFKAFLTAIAGFALLGAVPTAAMAQQTGTVTGTVIAQETDQPLAGVQVFVQGTNIGTLSGQDGTYTLRNVPAGTQEVRATILGYSRGTQQVNIAAGETVTANFTLRTSAVELEGITVNPVTGRQERRREIGTNTASIQVGEINQATVTNFSDVLSGRAAGVNLQQSSGTVGTSERIRIRGANSLSLSNEPLIYIDGVRASRSYGGFGVGGQDPSRLNDIAPADIENIEIVKGPAAAALYGTEGANGVILITTKRGRTGEARWNAYVETASMSDETNYPANYLAFQRVGEGSPFTPTGFRNPDVAAPCRNDQAAAGLCTQDELLSFNTLMDPRTRPFQTGHRTRYGLNVSGGAENIRYYVSGELTDQQGIVMHNTQDQGNFRANLQADLRDDLSINVTSGYVRSGLRLNNNDNSVFSPLINGLLGTPVFVDYGDDPPGATQDRNYGWGYRVEHLAEFPTHQDIDRYTAGLSGQYTPLEWLSGNFNFGLDLTDRHDYNHVDPMVLPIGGGYNLGFRQSQRSNTYQWTGGVSGTASLNLTDLIASTTTVGTQYERSLFESTYCYGADIPTGTRSCAAAAQLFSVSEGFSELITIGGYIRQQLAFDDRLFLTASLRGDDDSAFGEDFGLAWYPGISASWVMSEENWFPRQQGFLSELRLRAAAGTSGLRPGFRQALTLLQPVAVTVDGADVVGLTLDRTGNPDLSPERTSEFELGFDAGILDDRVALEFTYFNKNSRDALISRRLPPSLGLTATVFENLGQVRNSGTEASARILAFTTDIARLNLNLNHTTLRNEIVEMGEGVEDIIFNRGAQRHTEGQPAGAFYQERITWEDSNGDGRLAIADVDFARDEDGNRLGPQFIGPSLPTWSFSFGGDLGLWDWLTVSTLFDARGGNYQLDYTSLFRCLQGASRLDRGCPAVWDQNAPLEDQAAFIGNAFMGTNAGYIRPADFVKWRELAVAFGMPPMLTERAPFLQGATLTLAGRNLGTWTDYPGLDPEINETGGSANFTQGEFNTQPPLRHLTARLNFTF